MGAIICYCDYYEHGRYDLVSFVLFQSVVDAILSLPMTLDVFNSCEYICYVATHLIGYL